jgi:imidazole glycerol-phosphate synthase subunit HisH
MELRTTSCTRPLVTTRNISMASQAGKSIAIVDYGTGNIASLDQAFNAIGARAHLASAPEQLKGVDAIVLPGVGHFGPARERLSSSGMEHTLLELITSGLPVLGICLGFQLLTRSSEEAPAAKGLGLLPLHTTRLRPTNTRAHKVPHLGWNTIDLATGPAAPPPVLLAGIAPDPCLFYFANAYAIAPCQSFQGPQALYQHERPWLALVQHGNIHGVQFHPEKSRKQGLKLLRNFLAA